MKLKKKPYILVVGTGVLGSYLSKCLISENFRILVSTRKIQKSFSNYKKLKIENKVKFIKLDVQKERSIEKVLDKYKPIHIYYFAGQSSIVKSVKLAQQTILSNYMGAKKFLKIILKKKLNVKFFKSNTGYIFESKKNKINLNSKLVKPNNPYVFSQIKAFKLIKKYRSLGVNCYSIIFFNIESELRPKEFFIKKICLAVKNEKKIKVGNINIIRDFAWAPEILKGVTLLHKIKPCDIILASGKGISGQKIIKYLFGLKKLNYKNYIKVEKKLFRKNEKKIIISSMSSTLKKLRKFSWKPKIYGTKLALKMYKSL